MENSAISGGMKNASDLSKYQGAILVFFDSICS
jgi:hypothetical protein